MVIASTSQPSGLICYTSSIFDAALRSGEACAGALAVHAALPLGERGVDVQVNGSTLRPSAQMMNGTFCTIRLEMNTTSAKNSGTAYAGRCCGLAQCVCHRVALHAVE